MCCVGLSTERLLGRDVHVVRGTTRDPRDVGRDVESLAGHMTEVGGLHTLEDGFARGCRVHDRSNFDVGVDRGSLADVVDVHLSHLLVCN